MRDPTRPALPPPVSGAPSPAADEHGTRPRHAPQQTWVQIYNCQPAFRQRCKEPLPEHWGTTHLSAPTTHLSAPSAASLAFCAPPSARPRRWHSLSAARARTARSARAARCALSAPTRGSSEPAWARAGEGGRTGVKYGSGVRSTLFDKVADAGQDVGQHPSEPCGRSKRWGCLGV